MAHQVEQMMYVGATPWHGLGTQLNVAPASTEEAIRLAGLDWNIELQQLATPDGRLVERNAVVRTSDNSILGTVGMGWEPVQNVKAFSPFEPFLQAGLATIETAGSLKGGRRVWMLAKINRPDSVIVPQADDRVAKYLLAAVGHDGTLAFRLGYTPTRVVCMNTLSVAVNEGESTHIRIPHLSGATKAIDAIAKTIEGVDARFEKTAEIFRALAGVKIRGSEQLRQYVDSVFKPNKAEHGADGLSDLLARPVSPRESIFSADSGEMTSEKKSRVFDEIATLFEQGRGNDLPGVRGTAWAAYNAVTEQLTWNRGNSQDQRLETVWLRDSGVAARALPNAVSQFLGN
jgi:phage/plasmid-like protein (TIGR03299 family)